MRIPLSCLAAALALAGCARTPAETARAADAVAADQQKLDKALAGLTPGKPTDCLPSLPTTRQTEGIGQTILYRVDRSLIYRNDTGGGCERIARGDALVTVSPSGRLCRGDIARTVDLVARFPTGSCSLGSFVPYTAPR